MTGMKLTTATAILLALAACGGGGSGSGPAPIIPVPQPQPPANPQPLPPTAFEESAAAFQATLGAAGFSSPGDIASETDLVPTTAAQLPPPGSATYAGQIAIFVADPADTTQQELPDTLDAVDGLLLGDIDITVDFTSTGGTFDGTAGQFVDDQSGQYTGTLALENGELLRQVPSAGDPTDATGLLADFSGTLTAPNADQTVFTGDAAGLLSGPDADVVGLVAGDAVDAGEDTTFFGLFVATD